MTNLPFCALASPRHHVVVEAKSLFQTARAVPGLGGTTAPVTQTKVVDPSNTLLNLCTMIVGVNPTRDSVSTTRTGLRYQRSSRRLAKGREKGPAMRVCTGLCLAQRRMRGRRGGRDRLARHFRAWMNGLVGSYYRRDRRCGAMAKYEWRFWVSITGMQIRVMLLSIHSCTISTWPEKSNIRDGERGDLLHFMGRVSIFDTLCKCTTLRVSSIYPIKTT